MIFDKGAGCLLREGVSLFFESSLVVSAKFRRSGSRLSPGQGHRSPENLQQFEKTDSGFRRNDGKGAFPDSCGLIIVLPLLQGDRPAQDYFDMRAVRSDMTGELRSISTRKALSPWTPGSSSTSKASVSPLRKPWDRRKSTYRRISLPSWG